MRLVEQALIAAAIAAVLIGINPITATGSTRHTTTMTLHGKQVPGSFGFVDQAPKGEKPRRHHLLQ